MIILPYFIIGVDFYLKIQYICIHEKHDIFGLRFRT
jgi:hypothetical protein